MAKDPKKIQPTSGRGRVEPPGRHRKPSKSYGDGTAHRERSPGAHRTGDGGAISRWWGARKAGQ